MFGQNPIRKITTDPLTLAIEKVFYTIQGEGPFAGMPALFVRLAGCNLACHFCDTQFETQAETPLKWDAAIAQVMAFPAEQRRFVVVTGGEPMRQNWARLAATLFATGTHVIQVETAGTAWQPDFDRLSTNPNLVFVCSPKTPRVNPRIVDVCRHWKYIVRDGELAEDGLPNRGTQVGTKNKEELLFRPDRAARGWRDTIWLSPCDDYDEAKNLANQQMVVASAMRHGYRVTLQLHKILGLE